MQLHDEREHAEENPVEDCSAEQTYSSKELTSSAAEDEQERALSMRKRVRAGRRMSTREQINNMKKRQRMNFSQKHSQPYIHFIWAGIAVTAAACYLFHRLYLSTG